MISHIDRDISEKEMLDFFKSLPQAQASRIGLMGGWAITYLLKMRAVAHIGSRDIDVFFDPRTVSYDFISGLIRNSGFEPHSTFRWAKYFHRESQAPLSFESAKTVESFNLVTIFLDLAAPAAMEHVLCEPSLNKVFDGSAEFWTADGIRILVPDAATMVRIKIKALPERSDSFKREKDMADLLSMLRNIPELWETRNGLQLRLRQELRDSTVDALKKRVPTYSADGTISRAVESIGMSMDVGLQILNRM
jgi:hypothetical protein